jgi:nucleotide-binding universal stress UspA family protein
MSQEQAKRIVVGVDFDLCGDDAIVEGIKMLAAGRASELHAVHVLDPSEVIDDVEMPALFTEERVLEEAPGVLRTRIENLANALGLPVRKDRVFVHARIGKASAAIAQVAVDYDADLIVVGTHRRRGLDRLLLGSVAEHLVRHANCPVLVARPKDYSQCKKSDRPEPPYAPGEAPAAQAAPVDRPLHISTERMTEPSTSGHIF